MVCQQRRDFDLSFASTVISSKKISGFNRDSKKIPLFNAWDMPSKVQGSRVCWYPVRGDLVGSPFLYLRVHHKGRVQGGKRASSPLDSRTVGPSFL